MPRRISTKMTVAELTTEIDGHLKRFSADVAGLTLRDKVLRLVDIQYNVRCLNVATVIVDGLSRTAAIDRMRVYLERHVGIVIDGAELNVVSGIFEYARRIRQLRVEQGYRIATGTSPDRFSGIDLKPDQYMLPTGVVDTDMARRWHIANRIRKSAVSVSDRLLAFLKENVNRVVTTEELAYVAKNRQAFGKKTRELRSEKGYWIATRFSGRPDLSIGEYILQSATRIAEAHDRNVTDSVQREIYARDENRCRNPACRYQWTPADPRILELHFIVAHTRRVTTNENLLVLCDKCHDDVHDGRLSIMDCLVP